VLPDGAMTPCRSTMPSKTLLCFLLLTAISIQGEPFDADAIVRYGKSLDVSKLDRQLPSGRLEDWLSSGPPALEVMAWTPSDCDFRPGDRETRDGPPFCVKVRFRKGRVWG